MARTATNKARKVAKHLANHPNDTTNHGKVVAFPQVQKKDLKGNKPTLMHDIDGYFNKKTSKLEVPQTMYLVVADKLVDVEYTHLPMTAEEAYNELKCKAYMYRVVGGKRVLLASKKAVPTLSDKKRLEAAFGAPKK